VNPLIPPTIRAVILDLHGTLIETRFGPIQPDPGSDPTLRQILLHGKWRSSLTVEIPETLLTSPSTALHQAVKNHHATAKTPHPEIDLRDLWRNLLNLPPSTNTEPLVEELHSRWNPACWIEGALPALSRLQRAGLHLGILSNAQHDTLAFLRPEIHRFTPDLTIFSFQHRIAKPSPTLFSEMRTRLANLNILPQQTCFIGNHPTQDIAPATQAGFHTLLFHPPHITHPPHPIPPAATFTRWDHILPHQP
jgi:FMN phosphatase YigB (HAD superfamily)